VMLLYQDVSAHEISSFIQLYEKYGLHSIG
jgi:hypothetical protein